MSAVAASVALILISPITTIVMPVAKLTPAGFGLQYLQAREHHLRIPLGIDRRIVLRDAAFRIDDEGLAAGNFHQAENAVQYAVAFGGFLGAVRQQGEGQAMLGRKLLVGGHVIDADAA